MPTPKRPSPAFSNIEFLISASQLDGLPQDELPEVAFVGRSNVGKSSALNILANRRRLAFVSKTPGRTQLINLFSLGAGARLVDLPGYGYAKVPHGLRDEWGKLVAGYLQTRRSLLGVVSLMDARRPLTPLDVQLLGWLLPLERRLLVLLTKADKLTKSEQGRTLIAARKALGELASPANAGCFRARPARASRKPASTSMDGSRENKKPPVKGSKPGAKTP